MSYRYRSQKSAKNTTYRNRKLSYGRSTNKNQNQYIDPTKFIRPATISELDKYQPKHQFEDFELNDLLKTNLAEIGYTTTTPIQDQAIPHGLADRDIIGLAGTGTGKTAAFALPLLNNLLLNPDKFGLIIAPTRELAQQIEQDCRQLAKNSGLRGALLIGGVNIGQQIRDLRFNPRIIIGTPGRIKDHVKRGNLPLDKINIVVLDEVDRMLDMGFVNDISEILNQTSVKRQSSFFSATINSSVRRLIDRFSNDPVSITIQSTNPSESIHQDVVRFKNSSDQIEKLHQVLTDNSVTKAIVFDATQRNVEKLHAELVSRGFDSEAIHGGKSQGQRQRALNRFKQDEIKILVATDVAARGIDVQDISHVINYSLPKAYDDYIHRIGRAGRAGKVGFALTFIAAG